MQATIVEISLLSSGADYKTPQQFYPAALKKLTFLGLTDISEITSTSSPEQVDVRIAERVGGIDELLEMLSNRKVVNTEKTRYIDYKDAWSPDAGHIRFMANTSPESPIGMQQVIISLTPYWMWRSVENGFFSKLLRRIGIDKRKKNVPLDFLSDIEIKCHYTSGEEAVKGLYGLQQKPVGLLRLSEELLLHGFPEEVSETWRRLGGYISFHSADEEEGYTNFQELNAQKAQSTLQTVSMAKIILAEVEKLGITPESVGEIRDGKWSRSNGDKIRGFEQLIHATEYFNNVPAFSARYAGAQPPGSEIILKTALGSQYLKIDEIIDIRNGLVTVTSQAKNQEDRIRTLAALLDDCNQRLLQTGTAAYST